MSRRIGMLALCILLWLGFATAVQGQSNQRAGYYFKAAFLTNFARLMEWPSTAFEDENQPLIPCVMDPKPSGKALEAIEGKLIRGRQLSIRVCDRGQTPCPCHILFANSGHAAKRQSTIKRMQARPVFIVGESDGFARNGGMINFYSSKNKILFEINQERTRRAGLKISSRLLKLGRLVGRDEKR